MGTLVAIALLLLSGSVLNLAIRLFRRKCVARKWWVLLSVSCKVGASLGIWLSFFFEYQASDRVRIVSFPLPVAFFVWEVDRWTDFVTPVYYAYVAVIANIGAVIAAAITPLIAAFAICHRLSQLKRKQSGV